MNLPPGISPVILLRSTFSGVSTGLYLTGSAVFFTEYIGLSPQLVGLGLSVAWLISTATMVPFGMLADRFGGRRVWLIGVTVQTLVFCLYPFAHSYWQFQVIIVLELLFSGLGSAGSGRYFGDLFPDGKRARGSAFLRVSANIGMAVGAAIAGVAISFDTRTGYLAIILVAAAVTAFDAVLIAWVVPHVDRTHRKVERTARRKQVALRDRSFVALSVLNSVFKLDGPVLSVLLPLWILLRTDGPPWLIAGTMLTNMILCILFQLPASRGVETPSNGARAWTRAGIAMVVSCVAFALPPAPPTGWPRWPPWPWGSAALTTCELLSSAATWAVRYGLAPESRRGEYLAVFSLGGQRSWMAGPAALSFLVMTGGTVGWLGALAGVFVLAAAAANPMVAWGGACEPGRRGASRGTEGHRVAVPVRQNAAIVMRTWISRDVSSNGSLPCIMRELSIMTTSPARHSIGVISRLQVRNTDSRMLGGIGVPVLGERHGPLRRGDEAVGERRHALVAGRRRGGHRVGDVDLCVLVGQLVGHAVLAGEQVRGPAPVRGLAGEQRPQVRPGAGEVVAQVLGVEGRPQLVRQVRQDLDAVEQRGLAVARRRARAVEPQQVRPPRADASSACGPISCLPRLTVLVLSSLRPRGGSARRATGRGSCR